MRRSLLLLLAACSSPQIGDHCESVAQGFCEGPVAMVWCAPGNTWQRVFCYGDGGCVGRDYAGGGGARCEGCVPADGGCCPTFTGCQR